MGSITPFNPFATSRTRPGAIPFRFPDGQTADGLLAVLESHDWRGQIVGPHGSGKSTLLASLAPLWQHRGRTALSITLHHGQRTLPAAVFAGDVDSRTQVVIDGYEQLGYWQRRRLRRLYRKTGCGLLVTSHRSVGLPTVYQTCIDQQILTHIINGLASNHTWNADPTLLSRLMASYQGNVREILFHLYDVVEQQRQQPR